MFKFIILLLLTFLYGITFCQSPLQKIEKLKTQQEKIDTLKVYLQGAVAARDFNSLLNYTETGILLSRDHVAAKAYFAYYRGYVFQELKQYDSAIANTLLAIDLYKKDNNLKGETDAMRRLHYIYYYAGRGEERVPMMKKALEIIDTTTNAAAKSTLIVMLSEYYYDQSLYEKSIEFKLKYITLEKSKKHPLSDEVMNDIAVTNSQIAETYLIMKEPAKAIEYLNEAKKYYRSYYHGEALSTNNFITAFISLNQPDSALVYYKNLYQIMKPNDSLFEILSQANGHLARYNLEKNDTRLALLFAEKEFDLSVKSKEPIAIMGSHLTLASVYCKTKEFQKAFDHLKIAETNSYAFGREGVATIRYLQAQTYAGLGNWQQAYLKFDAYNTLHDSIVAESSTKSIADAEAKFQNKEKQQQIENKNIQLAAGKKERLWLMIGLALLALSALLLIIIYRNKKKTADVLDEKNKKLAKLNAELEEANQTKAKLFSIISHDLRSPISQVYQFLKLQQLNPQALNESQKNELSNKIQTATGSLLETMEDLLLWSKTQMSEFKTTIQTTPLLPIVDACQNLLQLNTEAKNIRYQNTIAPTTVINTDPYYLQTIIRNLLQNAVKASPENAVINISTKQRANGTVLSIKNEGNNFSQEQYEQIISSEENAKSLNGLGLRLVDELSQKIGVAVAFQNTVENGTCVEITLP